MWPEAVFCNCISERISSFYDSSVHTVLQPFQSQRGGFDVMIQIAIH